VKPQSANYKKTEGLGFKKQVFAMWTSLVLCW